LLGLVKLNDEYRVMLRQKTTFYWKVHGMVGSLVEQEIVVFLASTERESPYVWGHLDVSSLDGQILVGRDCLMMVAVVVDPFD